MAPAGIIRNRAKVDAAVHNAQVLLQIRADHGSFEAWLRHHHPQDKPAWVKLFKRRFRFTGGEIVGEFLMSTGWLPGAHTEACPVMTRVKAAHPAWLET
jgi:DNA-3-methyladenine glycosylase I